MPEAVTGLIDRPALGRNEVSRSLILLGRYLQEPRKVQTAIKSSRSEIQSSPHTYVNYGTHVGSVPRLHTGLINLSALHKGALYRIQDVQWQCKTAHTTGPQIMLRLRGQEEILIYRPNGKHKSKQKSWRKCLN